MNTCIHTPGPWIVVDDRHDGDLVTTQQRLNDSMAPIAIVDCDWDVPFGPEQQANAHLIAAAPDLLDHCIKALAAWEGTGPSILLDDLRTVIAKAEGKHS